MTIESKIQWMRGGSVVEEAAGLPDDERGFYRAVGERLAGMEVPNTLRVLCGAGRQAVLDVRARGERMTPGGAVPCPFVVPVLNTIGLPPSRYGDCHLTCINPDTPGGRGNYKFYRLHQLPDGGVTAYYERIGTGGGFGAEREIRDPMPSWMFEIRRAEKLAKGYRDRTGLYVGGKPAAARRGAEDGGGGLYGRLLAYAAGRVSGALACGEDVTAAQAAESRRLLSEMGRARGTDDFNARLMELMEVSPRSAPSVGSMLAGGPGDFARIIGREESLVAAMEAVATGRSADAGGLAAMGIGAEEVPRDGWPAEALELERTTGAPVRRVYRIACERFDGRYERYVSERGITRERTLWRGPGNENWLSIMDRSLLLDPNARITGKMFGHGIYFAADAGKSLGYTSWHGSYWAGGRDDTAFMGLYECAYGSPLYVDGPGAWDAESVRARGADCLHARAARCGLRHDEVVFYEEAAVHLRWLVEIGD